MYTNANKRVDDLLYKALVDRLTIALALDQAEDSTGELRAFALYMKEEIGLPLHERELDGANEWKDVEKTALDDREAYSVYWIDALPAFVALTLYPMPVEVSEETVDVVCASRVPIPLLCIVPQQRFILQRVRMLERRPGQPGLGVRCKQGNSLLGGS